MACPKCGCKVTYYYQKDDIEIVESDLERCSACGLIFDIEFAADDDDSNMLFHECSECNWRCNCSDNPCSHCKVLVPPNY